MGKILLQHCLKRERLNQGYTLRGLSRKTKNQVSNAYISELENGRNKNPSPRILYHLAKALEVKYSTLMKLAGYMVGDLNE